MEVKINREIRDYTESMFFGLSMRQFFFSIAAVGIAVLIYFVLKPYVGTETVSWMCILGAFPFAAMGFITYHGMTAEQFVWAWLRSEMSNGSMFADLCKYTDKSFYEEHPVIQFDTLSTFGEYQIVAVFKFNTNKETFKYNECVTMNEEELKTFMNEVHSRQLYDTGVDAEYGDQLLTLSTCEYTYKNGRLVVVAKKVG